MNNLVVQNKDVVDKEKVQLLKDTFCKGATDNELELFILTANRTGLDPFSKQCWAVKRWDSALGRESMAFQTGIDGFRVIANRSDKYAGQLGPYWCGKDGVWKDVWLDTVPPIASKVGVIRSDFKEPLWAVAKFSSYAAKKKDGSLTKFWSQMPDLMIAKVAECLALRKAFPQDLSGIYSNDEMDQANSVNEKDVASQQETKPLLKPEDRPVEKDIPKTRPAGVVNHAIQKTVDKPVDPVDNFPSEPLAKPIDFDNENLLRYGNHVIMFGKNSGKSIKEIDSKEIKMMIDKCYKLRDETSKPWTAAMAGFVVNAELFLKELNRGE